MKMNRIILTIPIAAAKTFLCSDFHKNPLSNNKPKIKIIKCVIKYPKKEINKEIRKQKLAKIPKNKNKTLTPKIN